jgi:hypothetical protein
MPLKGRDLCLEVKARADGFRELYSWLTERDVLIVKADHQAPLVVVRLTLASPCGGPCSRALGRRDEPGDEIAVEIESGGGVHEARP